MILPSLDAWHLTTTDLETFPNFSAFFGEKAEGWRRPKASGHLSAFRVLKDLNPLEATETGREAKTAFPFEVVNGGGARMWRWLAVEEAAAIFFGVFFPAVMCWELEGKWRGKMGNLKCGDGGRILGGS